MLSPMYTRFLFLLIGDCQGILDVILNTRIEILRALPLLTFLRIPYAFKILAMLQKRVNNSDENICRIIDNDTLQWTHYVRNISKILEPASAGGIYASVSIPLQIRDSVGNASLSAKRPYYTSARSLSGLETSQTSDSQSQQSRFDDFDTNVFDLAMFDQLNAEPWFSKYELDLLSGEDLLIQGI